MKFGRFYSMVAEGHDGTIANGNPHIINFPLTCRFQIQNDSTYTLGNATFQIYNLSSDTRADLYKDPLDLLTYKQIIFKAGYLQEATNPIIIFQGNIIQCSSYRQGPDWITEIQASDGAYMNDTAYINLTIKDGYTFEYAVNQILSTMAPTVKTGIISEQIANPVQPSRGLTLSGNPYDLLVRQCLPRSFYAYIYKEKAYVMTQGDFLTDIGGVTEISAQTGLLGSPRLQAFQVMARIIFEPKIAVQQRIHLTTLINRMTGYYTVGRIIHRGTISGAVCEELVTELTLYRPNVGSTQEATSAIAGVAA